MGQRVLRFISGDCTIVGDCTEVQRCRGAGNMEGGTEVLSLVGLQRWCTCIGAQRCRGGSWGDEAWRCRCRGGGAEGGVYRWC